VRNLGTKKQLILDCFRTHRWERVGREEISTLGAELRRASGPAGKISFSYIANVLREAGARVDYEDRYVDPRMEEPYASRLKGVLQFGDLAAAEASLRRLDAIYREYLEAADQVGTRLARSLVLKGKQRAASLAASSRVSPELRQQKQEIATWFRVWLETPDLFFDWLELRQQSEEFLRLFPPQ
jgi:hypothetical protein